MSRHDLFTRYSDLLLRHERMIRTLCLRQTDDAELLKVFWWASRRCFFVWFTMWVALFLRYVGKKLYLCIT